MENEAEWCGVHGGGGDFWDCFGNEYFDDVCLLQEVVHARFIAGEGNAIVLALEGFKYLMGDPDSAVTRDSLLKEKEARKCS